MNAVALIPARSGSKRVPGKNVRPLAGHPLLAYSIDAARRSGVFDAVIVSTDSLDYADLALRYGAEVPGLRPAEFAAATSPDIDWVRHLLAQLHDSGRRFDCFSVLRPTSPFRTPDTVRRAWAEFQAAGEADSLRAVEPCRQHPGKMWVVNGGRLVPVLPVQPAGEVPWHSRQYPSLPPVYVQNASLEIARSSVALEQGSLSGERIVPFFTEGLEGFDVNDEDDWWYAEFLLQQGRANLPALTFT
jgi:CMP-N-acetylneuraminic acid synthetase